MNKFIRYWLGYYLSNNCFEISKKDIQSLADCLQVEYSRIHNILVSTYDYSGSYLTDNFEDVIMQFKY